MEERLESEYLHSVQIPVDEICWIRLGKEIAFKGKMFDVKEMTVNNGFATLLGIYDFEEALIKNKIQHASSIPEDRSYPFQKILGSWLSPAICKSLCHHYSLFNLFKKNVKKFYPLMPSKYCNPFLETEHLPPNFIA